MTCMTSDQYVERSVRMRIEYLKKILRITQSYQEADKRIAWREELDGLEKWMDFRRPQSTPKAG